ncbi:hypothetical protein PAXRUDRAFT_824187 [Paxillus rubicundulus Ve08.2h10]|uniref:Protein BIG1 n=1 Tax=Paxillus rubicundulus Ve08.2h10 TaxID=930991 RepID=A0A0D0E2D7_9AGAM|nr:hypothetical protein PAXRUDRAFT_824187 [Paxillus rubicundulus Ve08.2h10]
MAARVALLALLPFTGVLAFSNTIPFVAWSSQSSDVLNNLSPGTRPNRGALLESIISNGDICSYDAVVVIDHPGLHSSDLRTLQPSTRLAQMIKNAPSSRQLPHVEQRLGSSPEITALLTSRCGSLVVDVVPGSGQWSLEADKKHVLTVSMPPVEGSARYRKTMMAEHEPLISGELEKLASLTSNHLVIYSGSHIPLERRQLPSLSEFDSPSGDLYNAASVAAPEGGILQNYQLLTPALIITLLVVLFILIPVVMLGINALASIQSPLRSEAPKGYSAQERKVQ